MFKMFLEVVKYTEGRRILRNYEKTLDAQNTWNALCRHARSSTYASITLQNLSKKIHTMHLDSSYNGPYVDWISTFTTTVEDFNDMQDNVQAHITPEAAIFLLQAAVQDVPVLNNVRIQDLMHVSAGTKPPNDYWMYLNCLTSAATIADEKRIRKSRSVNQHEVLYDTSEENGESPDEYRVYEAQRSTPSGAGRLDDAVWKTMSIEERKNWTSLPVQTRARIIEQSKSTTPNPARSVHHTEFDAPTDSPEPTEDGDSPSQDTAVTLQVNQAATTHIPSDSKVNQSHPGDVRRMLSSQKGGTPAKATNNKRVSVNTVRQVHTFERTRPCLPDDHRGDSGTFSHFSHPQYIEELLNLDAPEDGSSGEKGSSGPSMYQVSTMERGGSMYQVMSTDDDSDDEFDYGDEDQDFRRGG